MRNIGYLLVAIAVLNSGCTNTRWRASRAQERADQQEFARQAFREQRLKKELIDDGQRWDQLEEDQLLVSIEEDDEAKWARLPYETVDDWLERIFATLREQNDELRELEGRLESLQDTERRQIGEIQQLLQVQQELRETVAEVESRRQAQLENEFQVTSEQPVPRFFVHLVRPKDTLFSIAMHYYNDSSMVKEILRWNQRWVRSEYELVAGLALMLFPADASDNNPQVVEKFIEEMEIPR